jgi:hypothetical protein
MDTVKDELQSRWPAIVNACIEDILSRTPDPLTEFRYIQGYDGGIFFKGPGRHQSAQPDGKHGKPRKFGTRRYPASKLLGDVILGSDSSEKNQYGSGERISFIRSPGMWLDEAVASETNRVVDDGSNGRFYIGLGIVPILEDLTKFSWQNYSSRGGVGTQVHTSGYGMWSFFEEGKSGTQVAKFGDYKMKPYASSQQWYWQTMKFYPRKMMYAGFNPDVFLDLVASVIKQVPF